LRMEAWSGVFGNISAVDETLKKCLQFLRPKYTSEREKKLSVSIQNWNMAIWCKHTYLVTGSVNLNFTQFLQLSDFGTHIGARKSKEIYA
ncbi:hypothetical protein CISIN_1g0061071mg, partial [Citrus sinensis]